MSFSVCTVCGEKIEIIGNIRSHKLCNDCFNATTEQNFSGAIEEITFGETFFEKQMSELSSFSKINRLSESES